jgi:uncharacterized protein YaaN involved in tellurite resistance
MTPNQTDDVIAGYRKATDAQQDVIEELRLQIASLTRGNETLHKLIHEQLDEISILREQIESRDRLEKQLTAHKAALEKCCVAITSPRSYALAQDALAVIMELKGNQ